MKRSARHSNSLAVFLHLLLLLLLLPVTVHSVCNGQGLLVPVPTSVYRCSGSVVTKDRYNTILAQNFIARTRAAQQAELRAVAAALLAGLNTTANSTTPFNTANTTNTTNTTTPEVPQTLCTITIDMQTLCVCRHDWTGTNCTNQRPVVCELNGPPPSDCASTATMEQFHYSDKIGSRGKLCNFFDLNTVAQNAPLTYQLNMKCKYMNDETRTCNKTMVDSESFAIETSSCVEDDFDYWYDNKKIDQNMFVISNDPEARIRIVFYDMISLDYVGPNVSTNVFTGDKLVSNKFELTLPNGLDFVRDLTLSGGRLHGEFQFTTKHKTLNRLPLGDPLRTGILWQVPTVPITYNMANYQEPFVSTTNGVAILVIGLVLCLFVGIFLTLFVVKENQKQKREKEKKKRQ